MYEGLSKIVILVLKRGWGSKNLQICMTSFMDDSTEKSREILSLCLVIVTKPKNQNEDYLKSKLSHLKTDLDFALGSFSNSFETNSCGVGIWCVHSKLYIEHLNVRCFTDGTQINFNMNTMFDAQGGYKYPFLNVLLFKGVSVAQRSTRQAHHLVVGRVNLEHLFVQSLPNLCWG